MPKIPKARRKPARPAPRPADEPIQNELRERVTELHEVMSLRSIAIGAKVPITTLAGFAGGDRNFLSLSDASRLARFLGFDLALVRTPCPKEVTPTPPPAGV